MRVEVPIGVLTTNRAVYLDVTLKSLRSSVADAPITVYDDASSDEAAKRFLYSSDCFTVEYEWPKYEEWTDAGLGHLEDNPSLCGISDDFPVVKLDSTVLGVVTASCRTICDLFRSYPNAPGVILIQDDVVFVKDWYDRIMAEFRGGDGIGIIAGMHLDFGNNIGRDFFTAQCYLITKVFFELEREWFGRTHSGRRSFDVRVCKRALNAGFGVQLIDPHICQHIGVVSRVS